MRLLLRAFAIVALCLAAAMPALAKDEQQEVKVGVFITNLFDINFSHHDVEATFWVWFNHAGADFDPVKSVEIVNARTASVLTQSRTDVGNGRFWDQVKYTAALDEGWKIADFPFDRQRITLVLEGTDDSRKLRLSPDVAGTKLRRDLEIAGWKIEGLRITGGERSYDTAYGDPSLSPDGPSSYSRVTVEIDVKRDGWRLFLSTFIGFALAIALAGIVITSNAFRRLSAVIDMPAQLAIGTGALFSTVGAGYVLQNGLPPTTEFSLADAFQLTAFAVTFLTMLTIFVVHVLKNHKRETLALWIGRLLFALYVVIVAMIIHRIFTAVGS